MNQLPLYRIVAVITGVIIVAGLLQAEETNWGKWGPDDQIGTLNYITPDAVRYAARLVKQGKVISLGLPYAPGHPSGMGPAGKIYRYMIRTAQGAGMAAGLAEDHLYTETHGTSHYDGIVHFYANGKIYNGWDTETYVTEKGAMKNGIEHTADKMVGRGVLLDLARYKGVTVLPDTYLITVEDMEGAARKQGIEMREGDIVLVHSGWQMRWYREGEAAFRSGSPGIGWEVSQWLKQQHAAFFGSDTPNEEVRPVEPDTPGKTGAPTWHLPIHLEMNRNQGMMLGDHMYLHDLAEDCAADGIYEFMYVGPPLNILHGTGSPVNPQAIK